MGDNEGKMTSVKYRLDIGHPMVGHRRKSSLSVFVVLLVVLKSSLISVSTAQTCASGPVPWFLPEDSSNFGGKELASFPLKVIKNIGTIDVQFGGSAVVTKQHLRVELDYDAYSDCQIRVKSFYPTSELVGQLQPSVFSCSFRDGDVVYQHHGSRASANSMDPWKWTTDRVGLVIVAKRKSDGMHVLTPAMLHIGVKGFDGRSAMVSGTLNETINNSPPSAADDATLVLKANVMNPSTPILPHVLSTMDEETKSSNRLYFQFPNTLSHFRGEGRIVNTDDLDGTYRHREAAVSGSSDDGTAQLLTFFQRDVDDLKIVYLPPLDNLTALAAIEAERTLFELEFNVGDENLKKSEDLLFTVELSKRTTPGYVAERLCVVEGGSAPLPTFRGGFSEAVVVGGLRNGVLTFTSTSGEGKTMTYDNVDNASVLSFGVEDWSKLQYQHDGSNTYSDNIALRLTYVASGNSKSSTPPRTSEETILILVDVLPVDDDGPQIVVNEGVSARPSSYTKLTSSILKAVDPESHDVVFEIQTGRGVDANSRGSLVRLVENSDLVEANEDGRMYQPIAMSFRQSEVDAGVIFYRAPATNRMFMDKIPLRARDDADNLSEMLTLNIAVSPIDMSAPSLFRGATLQLTVDEYRVTEFGRENMRYTDDMSEDINYAITKKPFDTDFNNPTETGKIVLTEDPSVELETFTQSMINRRRVSYMPPSVELGLTLRVVQFHFEVEDDAGNVLPDQTFTIFLKPIDNKPPSVLNTGFTVTDAGFFVLNPRVLDAHDPDTNPSLVIFRLVKPPQYGVLQYDTLVMSTDSQFTTSDIKNELVAYVTQKSAGSDSFQLEVTDGIHKVPVVVHVKLSDMQSDSPFVEFLPAGENIRRPGVGLHEPLAAVPKRVSVTTTNFTEEIEEIVVIEERQMFTADGGPGIETESGVLTSKVVTNFPPVLEIREPLVVDEGQKALINTSNFDVTDNDSPRAELQCMILDQPSHGYIENAVKRRPASSFTLADLDEGSLYYVQNLNAGAEPTSDTVGFHCTDGVNFSDKQTFVIIIKPVNDEPPHFFARDFAVMEGMDLIIDMTLLSASDADIPPDALNFTVLTPPSHGRIVQQVYSEMLEVDWFTPEDISGPYPIIYSHDGSESTQDRFELGLSDGLRSVSHSFLVTVIPVDDEPPFLVNNERISFIPGQQTKITKDFLLAEDPDSAEANITYVIKVAPKYGVLLFEDTRNKFVANLTTGMDFTQYHIDNGRVFYRSYSAASSYSNFIQDEISESFDHSYASSDSVTVDVTDGRNVLQSRKITFQIDPKFALAAEKTTGHRSSSEVSSGKNSSSKTIITRKTVTETRVEKLVVTTTVRTVYLTLKHFGIDADELRRHQSQQSGSEQRAQKYIFTILRQPQVGRLENADFPDFPLSHFTDMSLKDGKIRYSIPADAVMVNEVAASEVYIDGAKDAFDIEVNDGKTATKKMFEVALNLTEHWTKNGQNKESKFDVQKTQFEQNVSDSSSGPALNARRRVDIFVLPVKIKQSGTVDLGKFMRIEELTESSQTKELPAVDFKLKSAPKSGVLLKRGKSITEFTSSDLADGLVTYKQSTAAGGLNSEETQDRFELITTSAASAQDSKFIDIYVNGRLITYFLGGAFPMAIEIEPVDDRSPEIVLNLGSSNIKNLSHQMSSGDVENLAQNFIGFKLSPKSLLVDDPDSDSDAVQFIIKSQPEHGKLVKKLKNGFATGAASLLSFTQGGSPESPKLIAHIWQEEFVLSIEAEVKKGKIFMVLDHNITEDVSYDKFEFSVKDPAGNENKGPFEFAFRWAWLSFSSQQYFVNESQRHVEVFVDRKGYLGDATSATLVVESRTAKRGEDFELVPLGSARGSVEFTAGQRRAVYRIKILEDTSFEGPEMFAVSLKDPKNAALFGNPDDNTAIVQISDPEDEPTAFIPSRLYNVEENAGVVRIPVQRKGDVSKEMVVDCLTRDGTAVGGDGKTMSADFVRRITKRPSELQSSKQHSSRGKHSVRFTSEQEVAFCPIDILNDSQYEEEETFTVYLDNPEGGRLISGENQTTVAIVTDAADVPLFYFGSEEYRVDAAEKFVNVTVWRTGPDLSQDSRVTLRLTSVHHSPGDGANVAYSANTPADSAAAPSSDNKLESVIMNMGFGKDVTHLLVPVELLPVGVEAPSKSSDLTSSTASDAAAHSVTIKNNNKDSFRLVLTHPLAGRLAHPKEAVVIVEEPKAPGNIVGFDVKTMSVEESQGVLSVPVRRWGDLSDPLSIKCYTRSRSASAGVDYIERSPTSDDSVLDFSPGEAEKMCNVTLIDDDELEGPETFRLVLVDLFLAKNASSSALDGSPSYNSAEFKSKQPPKIGPKGDVLVTLNDPEDEPSVQFGADKYRIAEPKTLQKSPAKLVIELVRNGDVSSPSVVHLYSKDGSARAGKDFEPISRDIRFAPGVKKLDVEVKVLFDAAKEEIETFFLLLRPGKKDGLKPLRRKATVQILDGGISDLVAFPAPPLVVSLRDFDFAAVAPVEPMNGYPLICISSCNPKHPDFNNGTERICQKEGIDDALTTYRWRIGGPAAGEDLLDLTDDTIFTRVDAMALDSVYLTPGGKVQCLTTAVAIDGKRGIESASKVVRISKTRGLCPRKHETFGSDPFLSKIRYSDDPTHPDLVEFDVIIPHTDGLLPIFSTKHILKPLQLTLSPSSSVRKAEHFCSNLLLPEEQPTKFGFNMRTTYQRGDNFREIGEVEPYQLDASLRGRESVVLYSHLDIDSCSWMFKSFFNMSDLMAKCGGKIATENQVLSLVQSFVSVSVPLHMSYVMKDFSGSGGWVHQDMETNLKLTFMYNTAVLSDESVAAVTSGKSSGKLHPQSMRLLPDGRLEVKFKTKPFFRGLYLVQNDEGDRSYVISKDHPHLQFDIKMLKTENQTDKPQQEWAFLSDYAVGDYSGTYSIHMIPCLMPPTQVARHLDIESGKRNHHDDRRASPSPTIAREVESFSSPPSGTRDDNGELFGDCRPQKMSAFQLKIRFQQLSDPVPAKFSLNTQFLLLKRKKRDVEQQGRLVPHSAYSSTFSGDVSGFMGELSSDSEEPFFPDDYIHGIMRMNPLENWGGQFGLKIEKCFLCAGDLSYVPKFSPKHEEYGCILPSSRLKHHFKILDRREPTSAHRDFLGVHFNASFYDPNSKSLAYYDGNGTKFMVNRQKDNPAEDSFQLAAKPLFQATYGTQWFVHCLYTIRSTSDKSSSGPPKSLRKRSLNDLDETYHHALFSAGDQLEERKDGPLHSYGNARTSEVELETLSRVERAVKSPAEETTSSSTIPTAVQRRLQREQKANGRRGRNRSKFRDKQRQRGGPSSSAGPHFGPRPQPQQQATPDLQNIGFGGRGTNMRRVPLVSPSTVTPASPTVESPVSSGPPDNASVFLALPWAAVVGAAVLLVLCTAAIAGTAAWCRSRQTERRPPITISAPHGNSRVIVSSALPQMYGETSEV